MTRAVVFDLWDTLVDWDVPGWARLQDSMAALAGVEPAEFARRWRETHEARSLGTLPDYLRSLGVDEELVPRFASMRLEWARAALVPRPGAVETLEDLRARGFRLGMVSVCSEEVPALWEETRFAGLFDSTVFSCSVGLRKPDPRIYLLACEQLAVEPAEALFVGDGANDELAGAERVGMRSVLVHRAGEEPGWPEVRDWAGPRITTIPEVLALL